MRPSPASPFHYDYFSLDTHRARVSPVAFLFERKGLVRVQPAEGSSATFDSYFEAALEGGAEDVREVETEDGMMWEVSKSNQ